MILVDTDEICAAIKDIFEDTRAIAEPAGALAVAGIKRCVEREAAHGAHAASPSTAARTSTSTACATSPSAPTSATQREALFAVTIPERPGSFQRSARLLGHAQRHRVQLPLSPTRRRAHLRRRRCCTGGAEKAGALRAVCAARGYHDRST